MPHTSRRLGAELADGLAAGEAGLAAGRSWVVGESRFDPEPRRKIYTVPMIVAIAASNRIVVYGFVCVQSFRGDNCS